MVAVDTQAVSDLHQLLVCSSLSLVDTNRCVCLVKIKHADHCLHLCLYGAISLLIGLGL